LCETWEGHSVQWHLRVDEAKLTVDRPQGIPLRRTFRRILSQLKGAQVNPKRLHSRSIDQDGRARKRRVRRSLDHHKASNEPIDESC
jgi:hypothetical protein